MFLVPRVLFDEWTYQDFESMFNSEDEIEDLVEAMVDTAKVRKVCNSWLNSISICNC